MNELNGLVACLRHAGEVVLKIRSGGDLGTREKKGAWDVVTEGDLAAERIIAAWLAEHYGEDSVDGEEGASRSSRSGRTWYLDAIDGTKNYSRGAPFFGISAGRADAAGMSDRGAICFAAERWSAWAVQGEGAFSDHPSVSRRLVARPGADAVKGALIGVGLTTGRRHLYEVLKSAEAGNVVMMGSVTYESLLVALGFWDAYVHTAATQFDVAAATVICREAGCTVTGIDKEDVNLNDENIPFMVTRSPRLTEELRSVITANWR